MNAVDLAHEKRKNRYHRMIYMLDAIKPICMESGVNLDQIISHNRKPNIDDVRKIIAYTLVKDHEYLLTDVARFLERDHSTVINMISKYESYMMYNEDFKNLVAKVKLYYEQ